VRTLELEHLVELLEGFLDVLETLRVELLQGFVVEVLGDFRVETVEIFRVELLGLVAGTG
jgi:hypothetical protein